ncbi:MAG: endonuclease III [Candidatus Omnitrophica bacterium]|nr:endonuclease III [Candidatus Omnitrophota bacterium]
MKIFKLIKKQARIFKIPVVEAISANKNPYTVLISCILSLRSKDSTTAKIAESLFSVADTPLAIIKLKLTDLEKIIYSSGFYRNKAKTIRNVSGQIVDCFSGQVPSSLDELLKLKGVGRKTANLVLGLGFNKPAICVDTHVNRIPNRLGWIKTKTAFATEKQLEKIFPKKYWIEINTVLVSFGQNVCLPLSPLCRQCSVSKFCGKIGVSRHR